MEKKEFLEITKKAFKEYGFKIEGKYYYLDLDDVLICATLYSEYGLHILGYNFSIKAIHDESERKKNDIFTGYDCVMCDTFDSNGDKLIDYKKLTIDQYLNDLNQRLSKFFDPFKKDALNYILNGEIEEEKKFYGSGRFMISKKAQEFFGIDLSK